ncbi:MAG: hypothetical protein LBR82_01435 [Desulfovibrio sp.]|jgi:hypothetical protein|nr:hypothetical protein [Desulfovibrio sp.]
MEHTSVAVVTDGRGKLARFADGVFVRVYSRENNTWRCAETVPLRMERTRPPGPEPGESVSGEHSGSASAFAETPAGLRAGLREFVAALGDTRILVAVSISGIAYTVLDQRGFVLCEMDDFDPGCLDALTEALNAPPAVSPAPDRPMPTGEPGVYACDLVLTLRAYPELSSKKILLPFLAESAFTELRVLCGHVPPWLPPELQRRGFACEGPQAADGKLLLRISPPAP